MVDLGTVSIGRLREALAEVGESKPTQRLIAAIAYKRGVTQTELALWFGVERKTIYNWLRRFESRPDSPAEAARDDDPPGRPRRLGDDQVAQLHDRLNRPPVESGYDAPTWTPSLVADLVEARWGVEYSRWSCVRLLNEAGLRYRHDRTGDDESAGGWVPA